MVKVKNSDQNQPKIVTFYAINSETTWDAENILPGIFSETDYQACENAM